VVDIMDAWPETFCQALPLPRRLATLAGRLLFASAWRQARRAVREADAVSAVGESYLSWARQLGATAPGTVCHHGIDLPAPGEASAPGSGLRLVYVGNMGRSYDLRTLLEAVRGLDDVRLDLAGTGPDEPALRAQAAEEIRTGRVRFHGQLPAPELGALLAQAHVGVIPMFDRSRVATPYKLADYAAAGVAILETLPGETRSLVESYGAGLWHPAGDVAACREAIRRLADHPGLLAACRAGARRLAEERFDAAAIYPAFCEWLEKRP
jgi:glycosyltransferase involved in cell wall biosynthesis